MAKSIRSKSRRRMRNVNRQHFAKKELERLYKCVTTDKKELAENVKWRTTQKKKDKSADVTVTTDTKEVSADTTMDVDKTVPVYDKKTKRDENGHYPPWMNQRSVTKHKKKLAARKKKGKVIKW